MGFTFPSNKSRAVAVETRPTANSIACVVVDAGLPSVAKVEAPAFVLKRKFRINGPVKGVLDYTNGASIAFKLTVPGFMTEIVFELPRAITLEGALDVNERFPVVNEPVGPCAGVIPTVIVSEGAILSIRTAA
jgi:hypothetical protein